MAREAAALLACVLLVGTTQTVAWGQAKRLAYPEASRVDQVDTYHGVEVADPYRWLERMDSDETREWVAAQERLLSTFLDGSTRERIQRRIHELYDLGDFDNPPVRAGEVYFQTRVLAGKTQPILMVRKSLDAEPRTLLDPNRAFSGTDLQFTGFTPSPDGRRVAYRVGNGQSIWGRIQVMDAATGEAEPHAVDGIQSGVVAWSGDSKGFFYVRYGETAALEAGALPKGEIRYHRLGDDQSKDALVYAREDQPTWRYALTTTEDGRYLVVSVREGNDPRNRVFIKDLAAKTGEIAELIGEPDATYGFLGSRGNVLWFYTDLDAPRGRIVAVDVTKPERSNWKSAVAERAEPMAGGSAVGGNGISVVGNRFVVLYRKDVLPLIRVFSLEGRLEREIELPISYVGGGFFGRQGDTETFYAVSHLFRANMVYRLDVETGRNAPVSTRKVPIDADAFEIQQVFYTSKDGTRVPMFVAHKKGLKLDGTNPVFMYGYGYGGWVAIPWYQPNVIAWIEMGGVYAMPNLRGGGEYGEVWRQAGIRLNRQNAIDDFVAAAEWLIKNRYTSPSRMVANGGSASGALAAAAVLQRPGLFGAGIVDIPVLDMLRYHESTAFKGWTRGFGSSEDPTEFKALYAYSPLHRIERDACYPPMLVTVGEKDQSAPPLHGYKFVATLQALETCESPALLKVVRGAGHSFGVTPEQTEETQAEQLAFLVRVLGME